VSFPLALCEALLLSGLVGNLSVKRRKILDEIEWQQLKHIRYFWDDE
jgi:hypothetical protein